MSLSKGEARQSLSDSRRLAEELYDYWISLLLTDKVDGITEETRFSTIPQDAREDFVEAVKAKVTDRVESLERKEGSDWSDIDFSAIVESDRPKVKKPCYCCLMEIVEAPEGKVGVCKNCSL